MSNFTKGVLECGGLALRYAEAGQGQPLLLFSAETSADADDIAMDLTTRHRVILLDVPASVLPQPLDFATHLVQALARLDITLCSVVGVSQGSTLALAYALAAPQQVQRLILVSPPPTSVQNPTLGDRLRDLTTPTLALVGTRDRSGAREAGRLCRERIPSCYLLLVYDAGQAIAADRREACLAPINEFLEQGEGFIVSHDSQMLRP